MQTHHPVANLGLGLGLGRRRQGASGKKMWRHTPGVASMGQ